MAAGRLAGITAPELADWDRGGLWVALCQGWRGTADWPESTESPVGKGNQREAVDGVGLSGCEDSG